MFKLKFLLLFVFSLCGFCSYAQLHLNGDWKYSFIDDQKNALPSYNDTDWKTKDATQLKWEKSEIDKKGNIIWMRKTVVIPSSMKKELDKTGALMLSMGRIRQEDQGFFNGESIGVTNTGDVKRKYIINEKDIRWDLENTIAVRIRHWGDISNVEEAPKLLAAGPAQLFVMTTGTGKINPKMRVDIEKSSLFGVNIKNNSNREVNGTLIADFYTLDKRKAESKIKEITLKQGDNSFNFDFKSPETFIKVSYRLNVKDYNFNVEWNDEFGYLDLTYKAIAPKISYLAKQVFDPAKLEQQTVLGWLGEKLKANKEMRLYNVDETGLLAGFINRPGVHPWIGEHVGKFLEAACNTYRNTGDKALKIQIDRTAQQLIAAQLEDGYLGTYDFDSEWTSWDVWSHKYDLIGLLSYYELSGYEPALNAAKQIGDLVSKRFGVKSGQLDIIKSGAHVGMAATSILDPMTDLYRFTGDKNYLEFCNYITKSYDQPNGPKIISTLDATGRVDRTANAKAYEMLSNIVGLIKLYRITSDISFLKPVELAWKDIVKNRLYITGTTSSFEHFQDNQLLPAGNDDHMGEGCVTTTWVQLNYQLLCLSGDMKYLNELERSVYNHLTGAENPQTGGVSYYTPLMGAKPYRSVITCCMSSVPRGIAMIPEFADGKINSIPTILFYQPGVYKTSLKDGNKVEFITKTNFPVDGKISIKVNPTQAEKFEIYLRKPYWAEDFTIKINGKNQKIGTGDKVSLERNWKKGDIINVDFNMPLRMLDGGASYPNSVAIQRGPQILVLDKNLNADLTNIPEIKVGKLAFKQVDNVFPKNWVGTQAYKINTEDKQKQIILVPYADASQTGGIVSTWLKIDK